MTSTTTPSPYKAKVDTVLTYIQNHLDEEMTVESLSALVNQSPFHFHRVYSSIAGETVYDSILRLRMQHAALKLSQLPSPSIIEIAFDVGFQSPSSFTRAFKRYYGFTPSEVQKNKTPKNSKIGILKSKYGKDLTVQDLYPEDVFTTSKGKKHMKVDIKKFEERPAIALYSSYEHDESMDNWLKLRKWFEENQGTHVTSWDTIGMYQDDPAVTPLDKCRSEICLFTDKPIEVKAPFHKVTIPSGTYAVARYHAKPEHKDKWGDKDFEDLDMHNFIQSFYKNWLAESGHEADNFPLLMTYKLIVDEPKRSKDDRAYFQLDYVDVMIKLKG